MERENERIKEEIKAKKQELRMLDFHLIQKAPSLTPLLRHETEEAIKRSDRSARHMWLDELYRTSHSRDLYTSNYN